MVAQDYRKAEVFRKFGIDFCCGGKKSLNKACEEKGISRSEVEDELYRLSIIQEVKDVDYNAWALDKLTDYIVDVHHTYINKSFPILFEYTQKVAKVHGDAAPEVREIASLFMEVMNELNHHMMKEENVLFPYIRQLAITKQTGETLSTSPFGNIQNPVRVMEHEHDMAGNIFKKIQSLSNNYTPPEWACNSYKYAYAKLEEFEKDLHQHIHLENNILFPKAIKLEEELTGKLR